MDVRLEFKPADCWIGVYWRRGQDAMACDVDGVWEIWICLLPMLPLHVTVRRQP